MIDHLFERLSLALVGLSTFAFCFLTLPFSFADDNDTIVDDVIITVPAACSIKDSTGGAGKTYNVSMMPGQYNPNIGSTTIVATCNDASGFALYAIGYGNEEYGNTDLITNLANPGASGTNTGNIVTGTAQSGPTSNWAMKLSTQTNPAPTYPIAIQNGFVNFSAVPSTYTLVAKRTSATDAGTGAEGARLDTHYAVYVSPTQVAATYTGKVRYTMVHPSTAEAPTQPQPSTAGCISYWPNASGVTDTMGNQCNLGNNASTTLWASNFQRPGYGFAGWTDKFDWVLNANDANGNGTGANAGYHIYGPNADITTPADMTTKGLSLYAVWVLNAGNLQSWNGCSTLNAGNVTALTDQRDNNTYAIAKLADGNCWMIENLRLDNDTTGNSDGSLAQGYASGFIGLANPETADFSNSTTANSLYSTTNITGRNQGYRFPRYNNQNTSSPATNMTAWNNNANTYSVGNWYTWSAAVADTSFYGTNNQTIANTSICPTGWKLPAGGDKNNTTVSDFWKLSVATIGTEPANTSSQTQPYYTGSTEGANASNVLRSYPNSFIYSGRFGVSSPSSRGSSGNYWSSTVSNSSLSYNLNLGSSNVYPGTDYGNKGSGRSVRCTISGS